MAHLVGVFIHQNLKKDVQRLLCYIVGFKMVIGNLCLRENLPFRSASPKTGPSFLSCSRSPSSARTQRALRLNRAYTSDWSWVRTKQSRRPRSARCMLMDTSQRMCGSPICPVIASCISLVPCTLQDCPQCVVANDSRRANRQNR